MAYEIVLISQTVPLFKEIYVLKTVHYEVHFLSPLFL